MTTYLDASFSPQQNFALIAEGHFTTKAYEEVDEASKKATSDFIQKGNQIASIALPIIFLVLGLIYEAGYPLIAFGLFGVSVFAVSFAVGLLFTNYIKMLALSGTDRYQAAKKIDAIFKDIIKTITNSYRTIDELTISEVISQRGLSSTKEHAEETLQKVINCFSDEKFDWAIRRQEYVNPHKEYNELGSLARKVTTLTNEKSLLDKASTFFSKSTDLQKTVNELKEACETIRYKRLSVAIEKDQNGFNWVRVVKGY